MIDRRVVVTGMGVVSPLGARVKQFESSLRLGASGLRWLEKLASLSFRCQVGGVPPDARSLKSSYLQAYDRSAMNECMTFAAIAAIDAWIDAGFSVPDDRMSDPDWDTGAVLGAGGSGTETIGGRVAPLTDSGRVRRLGSVAAEQAMSSNLSAKVGGLLGLGNWLTSNSSACATGTEAIYLGAERIRCGHAKRMLVGASESASEYMWAPFDALRVTADGFNDRPTKASRPMSASACGFVPSSGAGVLVLEELESALERGAHIHAEYLGGAVNSGGQRNGGTMTAPNPEGVQRCIRAAVADAGIDPMEVDAISGHLTGTMADPLEVWNWSEALGRGPGKLPWITAPKSLFGHALGAAGAIESVSAVLMLRGGYVHPSINCEDLHPDIEPFANSIPHEIQEVPDLRTVMKAGFGFGDVNACLVFRRWDQ